MGEPKNQLNWEALTTAWTKFQNFAAQSMKTLGLPEERQEEFNLKLSVDVLIMKPKIEEALTKYKQALDDRDVLFFRAKAGDEFEDLEIPPEMLDKFFQYVRAFRLLLFPDVNNS